MMLYRLRCWNVHQCLAVMSLVIGVGTPQLICGQSTTPSTTTANTAIPASLTGITTDTGAFRPGHTDFARYANPLACVDAATWASLAARANLMVIQTLDTLEDITADTFGLANVRTVARTCGARFTVANTDPKYLQSLLQFGVG